MVKSGRQLVLPIAFDIPSSFDDIEETDGNIYALRWLKSWPRGRSENFLCLVGGIAEVSTLASVWGFVHQARSLDINLFEEWYQMMHKNRGNRFYVIEDAEKIEDEQILLFIFNIARERQFHILFTARTPPSQWNIRLMDLKSRLMTVNVVYVS